VKALNRKEIVLGAPLPTLRAAVHRATVDILSIAARIKLARADIEGSSTSRTSTGIVFDVP
jgi:hypothetical protein